MAMTADMATTAAPLGDETTELSRQYETPMGLAHSTMQALKDRIKLHYDLASDYYLRLWGEHIHHGYWPTDESKAHDSKEVAQTNLISLLLEAASGLAPGSRVLDVGCGVGGTTRHLAARLGCTVVGITISARQVEIATQLAEFLAAAESSKPETEKDGEGEGFIALGEKGGKVKFVELDAERMGDFFSPSSSSSSSAEGKGEITTGGFDAVWISEALSHFPNKALFFRNAQRVLRPGGKLVLADWFKGEGLSEKEFEQDIKPIEDGMLLPPLCTQAEYVRFATEAGLQVFAEPKDISQDVSKTWDISWSLVQNPSLWAFAFTQGRDGIAFLQAFRAMRRGYANGSFRYAVMVFQK